MICKFDMAPPPGAVCVTVVLMDMERKVAGDVLFRNGHMVRDWRSRASILVVMVVMVTVQLKMNRSLRMLGGKQKEASGMEA